MYRQAAISSKASQIRSKSCPRNVNNNKPKSHEKVTSTPTSYQMSPAQLSLNHKPTDEYDNFDYVEKLNLQRKKIVLLTKIWNNNGPRQDDKLSIVFITDDDQVFGYGINDGGCLGIGIMPTSININVRKPKPIVQLNSQSICKLTSGYRFVIALNKDGKCWSWGENKFGQLGLGKSLSIVNKPTLISTLPPIIDVCCGHSHTIFLTHSNHIYSCGSNTSGSIGNGTTLHQSVPFLLTKLNRNNKINISSSNDMETFLSSDIIRISAGGWHSAALNRRGQLFVWGLNHDGQCGQPIASGNMINPTLVSFNTMERDDDEDDGYNNPTLQIVPQILVLDVKCGSSHTLVLTIDRMIYAFGANHSGQCGRDPSLIKVITRPMLIDTIVSNSFNEIVAFSKSHLSIVRTEDRFCLFGPTRTSSTYSLNVPIDQNLQQQQQQQNYSSSFNLILSQHESNQYPYDYGLYSKQFITLIDDVYHMPTMDHNSDYALYFIKKDRYIYFHRETIEQLCSQFIPFFIGENHEQQEQEEDQPRMEKNVKIIPIVSDIINGEKFNYETIYSYFSFIVYGYSNVESINLIKLLLLTELLHNDRLFDTIIKYVDANYDLEQLCRLFAEANQMKFISLSQYCIQKATQIYDEKPQILVQLYQSTLKNEQIQRDLELTCHDRVDKPIMVHSLIMFVHCTEKSMFFEALINGNNRFLFEKEFTYRTVYYYIEYIYGYNCDLVSMDIDSIVDLLQFSCYLLNLKLIDQCIDIIRQSILTNGNVCHIYCHYGSRLEVIENLCIELAAIDTKRLICSKDFTEMFQNFSSIAINFMLKLSIYLNQQTTDELSSPLLRPNPVSSSKSIQKSLVNSNRIIGTKFSAYSRKLYPRSCSKIPIKTNNVLPSGRGVGILFRTKNLATSKIPLLT
ncbi:RCC1 and BTB domain-containing protein 2 [Blomia tropicalis]|nr:RCC1 and BTB domain-containing protein 2 [Blomia tropicalis]